MRLKEKVVLVTGSTTGIGEGMVRRFALERAHVIVHGTEKGPAEGLANEIRSRGGRPTMSLVGYKIRRFQPN
jgi:NAD(P)-dependent dehydrogenase (short-subunit alcohol dehydrogenase family)